MGTEDRVPPRGRRGREVTNAGSAHLWAVSPACGGPGYPAFPSGSQLSGWAFRGRPEPRPRADVSRCGMSSLPQPPSACTWGWQGSGCPQGRLGRGPIAFLPPSLPTCCPAAAPAEAGARRTASGRHGPHARGVSSSTLSSPQHLSVVLSWKQLSRS